MTLRKLQGNVNLKRRYYIALYGELDLEGSVDLVTMTME
jgi:hypothetical protein